MCKWQTLYQRYPNNDKLTQKNKHHYNVNIMNVRFLFKSKRYENIGKITL